MKKDMLNLKEKYILEEDNKLDEPLKLAAMPTLNTHNGAWSKIEEMWVMEDRRLLFATKTEIAT